MARVSDIAKGLSEAVKTVGRMEVAEAREWVRSNDDGNPDFLEEKEINLVMGYGAQNKRDWWHREGTEIVAGPADNHKADKDEEEKAAPTTEDQAATPQRVITPQEQFRDVLRKLGLDNKKAQWVADYVGTAYDLYDPEGVWKALQNCPELTPVNRKRVMEYWVNAAGLQVNDQLRTEYRLMPSERIQQAQAAKADGVRRDRYIVVGDSMIPTDADDPDGMPYPHAYSIMLLNKNQQGTANNDEKSIFSTWLHEMQETERTKMQLEAAKSTNGHQKSPRYVAINGEAIPTDHDDPEGMTYGKAARVAVLQKAGNGHLDDKEEESLMVAMMKEMFASDRKKMELEAARFQQREQPDDTMKLLIESQRREAESNTNNMMSQMQNLIQSGQNQFTMMIEKMNGDRERDREIHRMEMERLREERKMEMDRIKEDQAHQIEMLRMQHDFQVQFLQGNGADPDPLAPLERILPGAWDKFIGYLTGPRESRPPMMINLEGGAITLEAYDKMEGIKMKRDMVNTFTQNFPDLIAAGLAAAKSLDSNVTQAPAAQRPRPQPQPQPAYQGPSIQQVRQIQCVSCANVIVMPVEDYQFGCPHCSTIQDIDGRIYDVVERQPAQSMSDEQPPEEDDGAGGVPAETPPDPAPVSYSQPLEPDEDNPDDGAPLTEPLLFNEGSTEPTYATAESDGPRED